MTSEYATLQIRGLIAGAAIMLLTAGKTVSAESAQFGEIQGRVFNVSGGSYLNNARIVVKGTDRQAFTNSSGEYLLHHLPPGEVDVIVSYTGLTPQSTTVKVESGRIVRKDFDLESVRSTATGSGKVILLDAFSVEETRMNAQSLALNEQRNAANIRNVVAAGEFGDSGEGSAVALIKYLPGVNVDSSTAGQGVSLRGFPSSGTLVTIDGGEVASSASFGGGRNIELGALRLNNISRIEVTKVPTPDLPANAQGGMINAISKSGFERRDPQLSYRAYSTFNSRGFVGGGLAKRGSRPELEILPVQPGFNLAYEFPINKSFALNFSGGATMRTNLTREVLTPWDLNRLALMQVDTNPAERRVDSADVALGAEWRMGDYNLLKVNLLHVDMVIYGGEDRSSYVFGTGVTGGPDFALGATPGVGTAYMFGTAFKRNERTRQVTVNNTYKRGNWKIDFNASLGRNRTTYRDVDKGYFGYTDLRITNLVLRATDVYGGTAKSAQPRDITAVDRSGVAVDVFDPGAYSIQSVRKNTHYDTTDAKDQVRADVGRIFGGGFSMQAGAALNRQTRDARRDFTLWNFRPTASVTERQAKNYDVLNPEYAADAKNYFAGHRPPLVSPTKLYELFKQRPDYFVSDTTWHAQNVLGSKFFQETVSAAYLRADLKRFENRLWIVGGVRFEKTEDEGRGPLFDRNGFYARDPNGKLLRTATNALIPLTNDLLERNKLQYQNRGAVAERSYDGFYPSLNASYRFTDDLILRVGYARTMGRPNLTEIVPNTTLPDATAAAAGTDRIIRVINAGLRPWTSDGYDISLDSYSFKGGVGSVGLFAKSIADFFGASQVAATPALLEALNIPEEFDGEFTGYDILTKQNVGTARISGVEASYRQSLYFLPYWGKNFQVYGNVTALDLRGPNSADFSNYVPKIINWGVSFARAKFSARLNWNQRGQTRLALQAVSVSVPASTYQYLAPRTTVSADFEYRFHKRLSLSGTATNLTDTPVIYERYAPSTPDFARKYRLMVPGAEFTLGIKGTF